MNLNITVKFHQDVYDRYKDYEPKSTYNPERPMANCPTDKEIVEGTKECANDVKECADEGCNIL